MLDKLDKNNRLLFSVSIKLNWKLLTTATFKWL